jgi:hypothetical protein
MSLISILVALIIAGLILWVVGQIPLDPWIQKIIRVVVVVFVVLWLLQAFGLWSGFGLRLH